MDSIFWACFCCGTHFHGSAIEIQNNSSNHLCRRNGSERENVTTAIKALLDISLGLPPPQQKPEFEKHQLTESQQAGQVKHAEDENRMKMPEGLMLELKQKLKCVLTLHLINLFQLTYYIIILFIFDVGKEQTNV